MMTTRHEYNAIIIGTGQAGKPLARTLAKAGWKVAIVERDQVGGTCINVGCTPTKSMVASARVAYLARRGADYGVNTGPVTIDLAQVRQRKRDIVARFRRGNERGLKRTEGIELLLGEGRFVDSKTVEVSMNDGEMRPLTADKIFINTGARPARPALPGLEDVPVLDSTSIMELDRVPSHLLVLGGGYIGLEFGQMFRRFGSEVTIIQRGNQLLSREDPDVAGEVAKILREDGIEVLLQTQALQVEQLTDSQIQMGVQTPAGTSTLIGSHLLVATGRQANTEQLNLAAAGINVDERGFIPVNERLETNVPGIYALGDVNGGPAFTHISYDDYRIIRTNLVENSQATTRNRLTPYTVYIDPQLGRVGLSETEALEQGRNIRVAKLAMRNTARALEVDETRGFMKAIVDAETDQILGAAVLGIEGGEIMSALQIAMMGNLPYTTLRDGVFAHPTLVESFNNLFTVMDRQKPKK